MNKIQRALAKLARKYRLEIIYAFGSRAGDLMPHERLRIKRWAQQEIELPRGKKRTANKLKS